MSTVNAILGYLIEHWITVSSIILFILTTVFGYKNPKTSATDYAKSIGQKLMFGLEKKSAEYLASDEGKLKFKLVVESGYNLFPPQVRLFISKPAFEVIIQNLHDEAIKFLEAEVKKNAPVTTPDLSISSNGNVIANNVVVTGASVVDSKPTTLPIAAPNVTVSQEALQAFISSVSTIPTAPITDSGIVANTIVAPESQTTTP